MVRVAEQQRALVAQARHGEQHLAGVGLGVPRGRRRAQATLGAGPEDALAGGAVGEGAEHRLAGGVGDGEQPAVAAGVAGGLVGGGPLAVVEAVELGLVGDVDGGGVAAGDEHLVEPGGQGRQLGVELAQPGLLLLGQGDAAALEVLEPLGQQVRLLLVERHLAGVTPGGQGREPAVEPRVEQDRVGVLRQPGRHLLLDRVALVVGVGGLGDPEGVHRAGQQRPGPLPRLEDVGHGGGGVVGRDRVQLREVLGHALLDRLAVVGVGQVGVVGQVERQRRRAQEGVGHEPIQAKDGRAASPPRRSVAQPQLSQTLVAGSAMLQAGQVSMGRARAEALRARVRAALTFSVRVGTPPSAGRSAASK